MTAFGKLGMAFLVVGDVALVAGIVGAVADIGVLALVAFIVAGVFLVLGITFTVLQRRLFGAPRTIARVLSTGRPAAGTLVAIGRTSGRVNADPIMSFTIRNGPDERDVRAVVPVQHVGTLVPGCQVPLLVDPEGSDTWLIDWSRYEASPFPFRRSERTT